MRLVQGWKAEESPRPLAGAPALEPGMPANGSDEPPHARLIRKLHTVADLSTAAIQAIEPRRLTPEEPPA